MNIEATELFKALKDQPVHEPPKPVTTEQKVEVANELHEWLNDGSESRADETRARERMTE